MAPRAVFVTGASGYIGGRLVPRLLAAGHRVVCLARERRKLDGRAWSRDPRVTIVACDVADVDGLTRVMSGCGSAYYLIHSMLTAGGKFRGRDEELARGFATAAQRAGVGRIVYLGGLGELGPGLSEHLASRREVETALASTSVPVTVLRAAVIIGGGSASFEILRYLVERLPVMITPRWVKTECQPIAVANVLHDLVACLGVPETIGATLDIGGPDVVSYRELMRLTQQELGVAPRLVIPVPVLTPRLSSLWIQFVTPISHRVARPLAEGLRNRVVCRDDRAQRLMPQRLLTVREAIAEALARERAGVLESTWSDAGAIPGDPDWAGGSVFVDRREVTVAASADEVFRAICWIGGGHGYYAADFLWRLRGAIDRLLGGPGLRRRRKDPDEVHFGDALDFWRVTARELDRRLELRAEMKLPGDATLSFDLEPRGAATMLVQTARFRPRGLLGLLYWWAVLPFHAIVFRGMLAGIRRDAERRASERRARPAERGSSSEESASGSDRAANVGVNESDPRPHGCLPQDRENAAMLMPLVSSALLLIASEGDELKPGETRPIAPDAVIPTEGLAMYERQLVDGTWQAGPCRISTPLPAGYPAPTAPGALELKAYPLIRKAQATALLGPEIGRNLAFWKLFRHIQSHEIAMTAPVEMRLDPKADDAGELAGWSMAFLYRESTLGKLGADGEVTVVEDAPITVVSIGVKGDYTTERALAEAAALRTELAKLKGWRAAGSPRALFYNGPDTRTENRWSEVQLPVERVPEPKPAPKKAKHRVI